MGQALHYCAIPPASSFYTRLSTDKAFAIMMSSLHDYGGIFHFQLLPKAARTEAIDELIQHKERELGPPDRRRRHIIAFLLEVDRLHLAHPGIEARTVLLEGHSDQAIKEQVSRELARTGRVPNLGSLALMDRLLLGKERLTPPDAYEPLYVVPADLVAQAAEMLEEINPFDLFPDDDRDLDTFEAWRQLYLDAAEHGEAIVVGWSS